MGIRQLLEDRRLRQQAAGDEGEPGGGGGGQAGGAGGQGGEPGSGGGEGGAPDTGGMMRSHSKAGEGGGKEGDGGEEDPFKASATDDGRPTIKDDQGNEIPLPDQFWDAENGQIRGDAIFKSWRDTRSSYDQLRSERDTLKQQVEQGKPAEGKVPEKPEDYTFEKPEEFSRELADDDPLLTGFKQIAHKHGIGQEQFQAVAADYLKMAEEQLGPPIDPKQEREKLGPNADTILQANAQFFDSMVDAGDLSQEEHDEIMAIGETAAGVKALNKIREKMGEQPIPMEGATTSELPSKQEWYKMVASEQYQQDPAYRQHVDKLGEQIFGTAPAGSSEPGLGVPG